MAQTECNIESLSIRLLVVVTSIKWESSSKSILCPAGILSNPVIVKQLPFMDRRSILKKILFKIILVLYKCVLIYKAC